MLQGVTVFINEYNIIIYITVSYQFNTVHHLITVIHTISKFLHRGQFYKSIFIPNFLCNIINLIPGPLSCIKRVIMTSSCTFCHSMEYNYFSKSCTSGRPFDVFFIFTMQIHQPQGLYCTMCSGPHLVG